MGDRNCCQLEFFPAVNLVGLRDSILEHLLISFLTEHGPNVHNLWFAAAPHAGAREENGEQKQTHCVSEQRAESTPVASPTTVGGYVE